MYLFSVFMMLNVNKLQTMKKQLLKWMLLFGCLVSGGWAIAQPGVKYPYVTTGSNGVVNTIVCQDYKGGVSYSYITNERYRLTIYGSTPNIATNSINAGTAPKFRVAAKDAATAVRNIDRSVCYNYKEDPSDKEDTWRCPTFRELSLMRLFYNQLGVFDADDVDFLERRKCYVSYICESRNGAYFCFSTEGVEPYDSYSSGSWYIRCVREVD